MTILYARETDGRIIAEIPEFPGVMAYGTTKAEAKAAVMKLGREVYEMECEQAKQSHDLLAMARVPGRVVRASRS